MAIGGRNSSSGSQSHAHAGDTCGLTVSGKVCSPNNWESFATVCGNLGGITEDSRGPPYRLNHQYQSLAKMSEVSPTQPDGGNQITIASTFYALCYYGNSDTWRYIAECAPGGSILNRSVPYINVSWSTNQTHFRPQLGDTILFGGNFENNTQMFTFVCGDYEAYDGPTCVLRTRWNQSFSATNDSCAPGKTVSIFFSNFDENFGGETLMKLSCYTKWTRSYIFLLMVQNGKFDHRKVILINNFVMNVEFFNTWEFRENWRNWQIKKSENSLSLKFKTTKILESCKICKKYIKHLTR